MLPERFRFSDARDIWLPLEAYPRCGDSRGCHPSLLAVARLKPEVDLAQARADLERFFGIKVFLELAVGVRHKWRTDERALREFGFHLTS